MGRCQLVTKRAFFGILALLLGTSCGLKTEVAKKRTTAPEVLELSLFREGTCSHTTAEELSEKHPVNLSKKLRDAVNKLATQAASFSLRYNQQHFPHVMAPQDMDVNNAFATDPLNPLILSQDRLAGDYQELGERWQQALGTQNLATLAVTDEFKPFQKLENLNLLHDIHREVLILKRKVDRFHALSCSYPTLKARSQNDMRPYYKAKAHLEKGFSPEDPSMEAFLLSMCSEFNTDALCGLEYLMSKRQGKIGFFYENSSRHFQKRLAHFFEPFSASKWKCHQEEGQTVVTVNVLGNQRLKNQLFGTYDVLKSFIGQKWSNDKVRVDLKVVDPSKLAESEKAINVAWSPTTLSFVSRSKPYIMNLSSRLNFSQLSLVFAHELGHVLGFPDCYHEFYDEKTKEIIYYALDKDGRNLMCHLNGHAKIPDSYLERLPGNVCL